MGVVGEPIIQILGAGPPTVSDVGCIVKRNVLELRIENGPGSCQWKIVLLDKDIIAGDDDALILVQWQHFSKITYNNKLDASRPAQKLREKYLSVELYGYGDDK